MPTIGDGEVRHSCPEEAKYILETWTFAQHFQVRSWMALVRAAYFRVKMESWTNMLPEAHMVEVD